MRIAFIAILLLFTSLSGAELPLLNLKGYLGKEQIEKAQSQLASFQGNTLILEVNSNSGDLQRTLELAKKIYEMKIEKNIKVIVYIEDNALGPAAIFPFLADELYSSLFVSWGDIPLGSENVLSSNLLRSQVVSLISLNSPHAQKLRELAEKMADKDKNSGETLVINQNQLKELGIAAKELSPDNFRTLFAFKQAAETAPIASLVRSPQFEQYIKYNPQGKNSIGWISLADRNAEISQGTWLYVKKALDYYKEHKPIFIVLELNSPGGEVFSAEKISDGLKEIDTQYNIPVICFIDNWAMSAGALIAYSCRFIAVVKDSAMGAAEPLTVSGEKVEVASEKVNSALRADFANRAAFFGRNGNLAEAMVDKDTILVLRHGAIIKLDSEDQIHKTGPDPDIIVSHKGKLLTLNSEQLMKYGVADLYLPPEKLPPITPAEKEAHTWPANKTLLFTSPFFAKIPEATIDAYGMDWKTQFFVLLANPVVQSALFLGLMLGLYMEISSPGFGFAATLAATCLFLITLSSFALEIASWLELIFLLTGLAIILVELFVLPTFGLLGFIGILLFFVGLFGMMLPGASSAGFEFDTKTFNAAGQVFFERLAWLCGTLLLAFGIILVLSRYLTPSFAGFRRFILQGNEQKGYIAGENPKELPQPGEIGEAFSALRPAGKVTIHDKIYDALSTGGFIEKGSPIIVDRLEGSDIIVKNLEMK